MTSWADIHLQAAWDRPEKRMRIEQVPDLIARSAPVG